MEIDVTKFLKALYDSTGDDVLSFTKIGEWLDPITLNIDINNVDYEFQFFEDHVRIEVETEPFSIININCNDMVSPEYLKSNITIYAQFKERAIALGEEYLNRTIQRFPL